ncbi:hypothetical protein LCGC14_1860770 [marine sediment metagenome]|uniref:Uncharacterized protein n=1 Tax=marine sediment metagenome TaxID=412755 RepID=A0A0F9G813_9ZZZZ
MAIKEEFNHLFDSNLSKYEDKLVDLLLDIAQQKRVNRKLSTIFSYLLIHGELTQKELKKLTRFSMGTISTFLSVIMGAGNLIQKRRIPKTHAFVYSFSGELRDLTVKGVELSIKSIISMEGFFRNSILKLYKLGELGSKGAKHLSQRIAELLDSFTFYKKFFPDVVKNPEGRVQKIQFFQKKEITDEVKEIEFDREVYIIEEDIHTQLAVSQMFSTRDPFFIKILGLFITRKYLTQKTLKNITGLSSGKISQEVNQLLGEDLIKKAEVTDKGKIIYGANFAGLILLNFTRSIILRFTKWEKILEEMKLDFENYEIGLRNLKGYEQINDIINFLIETILRYKKSLSILDKVLNN